MKNENLKPTKVLILTAVGTASLLLSAVSPAVSCGDVIRDAQVLASDILNCSSHPAITLDDNGSLDLNGYSVSCTGGDTGIGILLQGSNNILEDSAGGSLISNCSTGVSIEGDGFHHVSGISASANSTAGISFTSLYNVVENSYANNNTAIGIRILSDADHNSVFFSEANGNGAVGFRIIGESTFVSLSEANDNSGSGIFIATKANYSLLIRNTANNNGGNGILRQSGYSYDTVVVGNTAMGNSQPDLVDQQNDCDGDAIWAENIFIERNQDCIQ
ncbi:right-handed parallel beta-helix repeat-containing protein [Microbulbifer sp. SSSA002]|uniref:right-handed parallel beta-helix repeat-containing protein n=1 Tax=Microbulbifer sp. SSSA002 TaxID=3243376 RepID=UPI00403A248B